MNETEIRQRRSFCLLPPEDKSLVFYLPMTPKADDPTIVEDVSGNGYGIPLS